ncbi:DMP19 family protein [Winogradskyella sediminis]|uniref:DMP19 family protein n=1 Tax=Winogradskyella sediminis TaxID=1382466 RepID=UPI000E2378F8|nr:DMP19 family protein [Winogradskyella sediminis]
MNKRIITIMILTSILSFFGCKGKNEPNNEKSEMDLLIEKSVDEFNNRKIYKKLTPEIIITIPDDKLEQAIMDNIDTYFEKGEHYTLDKISKLTKGQQAVFSTWWLEAEVNNGGFNQFYFNSSGQYAEMAKIGFKTIGAEKFSELTLRANNIFTENKERLEEFDDGTMESFSESYKDNPLNDLDTEFYKLYDSENISDLRIKYIRENNKEFTTE